MHTVLDVGSSDEEHQGIATGSTQPPYDEPDGPGNEYGLCHNV